LTRQVAQGTRQLRQETTGRVRDDGHGGQSSEAPPGEWSRQHGDDNQDDIVHTQRSTVHQHCVRRQHGKCTEAQVGIIIVMPPPTTGGGGIMFSSRPSVRCPPVNICFA